MYATYQKREQHPVPLIIGLVFSFYTAVGLSTPSQAVPWAAGINGYATMMEH